MTLSRAAYYAFSALTYMARRHTNEPVSSAALADTNRIPPRFLLKVMRRLVTGGVVSSTKGPTGGYSLARCPSKITLLEVMEAVEGPLTGELPVPRPGTGDFTPDATLWPRLRSAYRLATAGLRSGFAGFTLAELAGKEHQ